MPASPWRIFRGTGVCASAVHMMPAIVINSSINIDKRFFMSRVIFKFKLNCWCKTTDKMTNEESLSRRKISQKSRNGVTALYLVVYDYIMSRTKMSKSFGLPSIPNTFNRSLFRVVATVDDGEPVRLQITDAEKCKRISMHISYSASFNGSNPLLRIPWNRGITQSISAVSSFHSS